MKYLKASYIRYIIGVVLITKYISFLLFPFLGADGPWSLSQTYSYINGLKDKSVFAHDFLGNIFTVHIIDFIYSIWFKIFSLSTYSFMSLGYTFVLLTLVIWGYLATKLKNFDLFIYLLMFGYAVSPYVYGFRPENFTILIISLAILFLMVRMNENFRILLISVLCVISGLIHHVGGLICLVLILYYFLFENRNYLNLIKLSFFGILFSILFTNGEILNYILLPLKIKSEVGNHLSSIDFSLILKYLIYSGPIPIIVLFLFRKALFIKDIVFLIFVMLLLSFLGRSYYIVYIYVVILFIILIRHNNFKTIITIENTRINQFLVLPSILYSVLFLFLIPVLLIFLSPSTNATWRDVITSIEKEKVTWEIDAKYFVPAQLTLEVASNSKARLLYSYMHHNDGIQETSKKVFYVNTKKQIEWIEKNFNTQKKKIIIEEVVLKNQGNIMISSIYKFKINRTEPIGLWKIYYIDSKN